MQSLLVEKIILYLFALEHPTGFSTLLVAIPLAGASTWADQPVAAAARAGHTVVLDGIHRLPKGALVSALSRLCHEGEVDLPDGSRLTASGNFQLVVLAEPGDWITPEVASLFATHLLPEMTPLELTMALPALVPTATPELCQQIANIATAALLTQNDTSFSVGERGALRLSLRVLLRLTRQAAATSTDAAKLRVLLHEALMSRFLPWRLQDTIDGWLEVAGLAPKVKQDSCLNN